MSTTYSFVKVAAGEPFPWESDIYAHVPYGPTLNAVRSNHFYKGDPVTVDQYFLRPVEPAADGGREAEVEKRKKNKRWDWNKMDLWDIFSDMEKEFNWKLGAMERNLVMEIIERLNRKTWK